MLIRFSIFDFRCSLFVFRFQADLQHLVQVFRAQLQPARGICWERIPGNEPDDLAFQHAHAIVRGLARHGIEHRGHGRLLVIRKVHRHLDDATVELHAQRFDVGEPAAACADDRGDALGDAQAVGREVHVVRDQDRARADGGGAGRRMRPMGSVVRAPRRLLHAERHAVELRLAEYPRGFVSLIGRCFLGTEIRERARRSATSAAVLFASATHCSIVAPCNGTKGTTSTAPIRGWTPSCDTQVDRVDGGGEQPQYGVLDWDGIACERVHRTVVRWIGRLIEHVHAGSCDRGAERGDDVGAATFADVGYALNHRH